MMKTILVTFVLFHSVEFKMFKVFDTKIVDDWIKDGVRYWSDNLCIEKSHLCGVGVILYFPTGSDSAQPIKVVQDFCVKD